MIKVKKKTKEDYNKLCITIDGIRDWYDEIYKELERRGFGSAFLDETYNAMAKLQQDYSKLLSNKDEVT